MDKDKNRLYFRIGYSVLFVLILIGAFILDVLGKSGTVFQSIAMVALPSIMAIGINDYRTKPEKDIQ